MGIQGFKECLQGTKVNLSDLIKNRMSGAPPLRIGVDLSDTVPFQNLRHIQHCFDYVHGLKNFNEGVKVTAFEERKKGKTHN